jgi:hypothetical protein
VIPHIIQRVASCHRLGLESLESHPEAEDQLADKRTIGRLSTVMRADMTTIKADMTTFEASIAMRGINITRIRVDVIPIRVDVTTIRKRSVSKKISNATTKQCMF